MCSMGSFFGVTLCLMDDKDPYSYSMWFKCAIILLPFKTGEKAFPKIKKKNIDLKFQTITEAFRWSSY